MDQKKSDSTANARSHDFMFRLLDTGNKTTIPYYTDQNGGVALALNGTRCCGTRAKKQAHKVDYEMILKEAATTNPEALHRLYCATIQILSVAVPERTGSPQGRNTTAAVRTSSEGSRGDHDRAGYTQRRKLKAQHLNEGGEQDPDGLVGSTRVEKHTVHTLRDGGRMELDAEELFRQEGYLRAFGCVTAKWSRRRIQQFQDSTSSAAIEQARLLIHWNKWRVRYVKIAVMFDAICVDKALRKAMRKRCTVRKVRQRMAKFATDNSETVEADITGETHVAHTPMDNTGIESVETEPVARVKPSALIRSGWPVTFSPRVNCFALLHLSAWNRCRQSLSFGGKGPKGLDQVRLDLSAEGVVGFNATESGIRVGTTVSADETIEAIKNGVSLWMRQNEPVVITDLVKEVSIGVYKVRGDVALLMVADTQPVELVTATGSYRSEAKVDDKGSWKERFEDAKTTNRLGHVSIIYSNKPNALDTSRSHSNQVNRSTMSDMKNSWFGM